MQLTPILIDSRPNGERTQNGKRLLNLKLQLPRLTFVVNLDLKISKDAEIMRPKDAQWSFIGITFIVPSKTKHHLQNRLL